MRKSSSPREKARQRVVRAAMAYVEATLGGSGYPSLTAKSQELVKSCAAYAANLRRPLK